MVRAGSSRQATVSGTDTVGVLRLSRKCPVLPFGTLQLTVSHSSQTSEHFFQDHGQHASEILQAPNGQSSVSQTLPEINV